MTHALVAACTGYNSIGARIIRGIAVTTATAVALVGYTWSGVLAVVVGWMFGGVGCHATSKGAKLSYNIGYLITAALFCPDCPHILRISWISTFCEYSPHFVDVSAFCGYYPHIVDIVYISAFRGYYLYQSHYKILSL